MLKREVFARNVEKATQIYISTESYLNFILMAVCEHF